MVVLESNSSGIFTVIACFAVFSFAFKGKKRVVNYTA